MSPLFFLTVAVLGVTVTFLTAHKIANIPGPFFFLTALFPFAAGGFFSYLSLPVLVLLAVSLFSICRKQKGLRFVLNRNSIAILAVVIGYCVTPLWAADKGMSMLSIPRYLPLLFYMLLLMQYPGSDKQAFLGYIPICGVCMTVLSLLFLLIPSISEMVTVNGRLASFLQYPNTFAIFLLSGLIIHIFSPVRAKWGFGVTFILIFGIILSGSRTVFILLAIALLYAVIHRKDFRTFLFLAIAVACGLILSLLLSSTQLLHNTDRFTTISPSSGTFLVRLLYFKDALPIILRHPFGIGYWGYRAIEGSFQTGRYSVSYVHNGFLQMLLDIGWIPSLLLAASFLAVLLSRKTAPDKRLLLFVILGHCMLDFDLQFMVIWFILLALLDFDRGRLQILSLKTPLLPAICAVFLLLCGWLGIGDYLYHAGNIDACIAVMPFHTDALTEALQKSEDIRQTEQIADRILAQNPTHSLAFSAKANAALAEGNVLAMMEYKEQAISCSQYALEEYCDYFDKLLFAAQSYSQAGDRNSADFCLKKLQEIPRMMQDVTEKTDPLAYLTGDDSTLELPEAYTQLLDLFRQN